MTQKNDARWEYFIAYASRKKNKANHSSYEGETFVVIWAIFHFLSYLYGQKFTLVNDAQPLKLLMKPDKFIGKLVKWVLLLQNYNFEVVHGACTSNLDGDGFFCNPNPLEKKLTKARFLHTINWKLSNIQKYNQIFIDKKM